MSHTYTDSLTHELCHTRIRLVSSKNNAFSFEQERSFLRASLQKRPDTVNLVVSQIECQCVAVCCSVLQCVGVWQCVAVCCSCGDWIKSLCVSFGQERSVFRASLQKRPDHI